MYIIRVLLCVLMMTGVSAAFADTADFITVSELNKVRKKKSFVDVDAMLNRKGWLTSTPEQLGDKNVTTLEWSYGIDYKMSFERTWKRLCNVVMTTTKFNADRFISKNLSKKYRLVLQTRTKTFYRNGNEMVMLKTNDKSNFVTLTFATKDDDYWRMMEATKSDPDVRRLDTYQIGDYIEEEGGILFYVSEDYEYGYILAMTDVGYGKNYNWGEQVDIKGDFPFTTREWHVANYDMRGSENTGAICRYLDETMDNVERAAQAARSYTAAGKNDWYLPSIGQLRTIKDDIHRINRRLKAEGGISIANAWYWSSTEYDYVFAWAINFKNNTIGRSSKSSPDRVRAVRTVRIED